MIPQSDKITNASITFLSVALIQFLASLFILPVYLNTFSVEEFGTNELVNRLALLLTIIIGLRISGAMANIYFTFDSHSQKQRFVSSLAQFTTLSGISSSIVIYLLGYFILPFFNTDGSFNMGVHGACAILSALASNIMSPYFFYLKNERKHVEFLVLQLFFIVALLGIQLLAIYLFHASFNTVIQLRSGFAVFQIIFLLFLYQRSFSLTIEWALVRRALNYTVPLIPFLLLNWTQLYFDRIFVGTYLGTVALGVFSFLLILQNMQTTLVDVFENAIRPALMNQLKRNEHSSTALLGIQNKFLLSITVSGACMLLGTILLPLITSNNLYVDHAILFFLIVPTGLAKGISLLFMQQLIFKEKSGELLILVAIHVLGIFLLYYLWQDQADLATVLWINLLMSCSMVFLYYYRAQKAQQLHFRWQQFYLPITHILVCMGCYFAYNWYHISITTLLITQLVVVILPASYLFFQSRKTSME